MKKKVMGLLLAVAMVATECVSVFASGSMSAAPITKYEEEVTEGTTIDVDDELTVAIEKVEGAGETTAEVALNEDALAWQLLKLKTGAVKKVTLEPATQAGSTFKGYQITINGKTKIVKSLSAKDYAKLTKNGGTITMKPVFTAKKFNATIKLTKAQKSALKADGYTSKQIKSLQKTLKNCSYTNKADLPSIAAAYAQLGLTVTGWADASGNLIPDSALSTNGYMYYTPDGAKKITLYPVFESIPQ